MSSFIPSILIIWLLTSSTDCARNTNSNLNSNSLLTESCDEQDSTDICIIENRFIEIASWQIERNRKVTSLRFSNLQSENLPINVGESFPNLISYTATDTSFRILKKENLRHLRVLEELKFTNGQLIRIRRDAFDDMPNLQRLDMGYNLIKVIAPENFREIDKLEFLSFKNNEIEEISPRMFRSLLNLKEFNMDDNKISSITGETFTSNRRLKKISMKNNSLKFVDASTFNGLKELQILDFSGNDCIDKAYLARSSAGGFLATIRMDMSNFCQIGVKD